jgi:hypothetical protein
VIAIENVRVFDEIQEKNCQLQQASEHKSQFVPASATSCARRPTPSSGSPTCWSPMRRASTRKRRWNPCNACAGTLLLGLTNQVLDLSEIEAGKLEHNPQTVQLVLLIDEVVGTARQLAEQNTNRFIAEAPESLGSITVDPAPTSPEAAASYLSGFRRHLHLGDLAGG